MKQLRQVIACCVAMSVSALSSADEMQSMSGRVIGLSASYSSFSGGTTLIPGFNFSARARHNVWLGVEASKTLATISASNERMNLAGFHVSAVRRVEQDLRYLTTFMLGVGNLNDYNELPTASRYRSVFMVVEPRFEIAWQFHSSWWVVSRFGYRKALLTDLASMGGKELSGFSFGVGLNYGFY